ncbi:unnamed protein product [Paramecium primaurelia]|uniref:Uncharacterized protein n=1 Tax=Paramecium primaurelia TaxID=5886 RepID=A0A8S1NX84_PARPR|nr:unnamed protein product [Paramecium primaurelia]
MPETTQWQLVQKVLIFGILSSLISSFGRADYNLPLFIFAIFLWEFEKVQIIPFQHSFILGSFIYCYSLSQLILSMHCIGTINGVDSKFQKPRQIPFYILQSFQLPCQI